ncbi:MAG: type II secretion system GspH family protein, partial [Firmicutes bacterium]|nr:type II secretion system GspH family protein [Bacillota bacterium]
MNKNKLNKTGMTLVEILVATFIFGLLMSAVAASIIISTRAYRFGDSKTPVFRNASIGFERIVRELRACQAIYSPGAETLKNGYTLTKYEDTPFVFLITNPQTNQKEVVAYYMDEQKKTIERALYAPDFDIANPESQNIDEKNAISVIKDAKEIKFLYDRHSTQEFLQVEVSSNPDEEFHFQTKVSSGAD